MSSNKMFENKILQDTSKYYSKVVQHLNEGIIILQGDRVVYANPSFCRITERDMCALIGKKVTELFPFVEQDAIQSEYDSVLKTRKNSKSHEFLIMRASEKMYVELTMSYLESEESPLILATVTDVTAKRGCPKFCVNGSVRG